MIGHNPKASQNQSDDFQDVAALLRSLPQVAAPADFNASLKARIAAAKAEANEFADITSLIKELPRVAAPSDFDFRLRARIAQAKAEQQKNSAGWFANLWGGSFSWLQAGAAMAAVAIIVSVGAFGVLHSGDAVKPSGKIDLANSAAAPVENFSQNLNSSPASEVVSSKQGLTQVALIAPPENRKSKALHLTGTTASATQGSKSETRIIEEPAPQTVIAGRTVIIKHRSGEAREVNLSEYNLGLQTANLRTNGPKTTPNRDEVVAANIY